MSINFKSGAMVLYKKKCGTVSAVSGDKIEIRIEGGASKSVSPKDIEFIHPGPVSALPPRTLPEPDMKELLELLDGESISFAEFCELAYGSDSAEAAWSAWKLLEDGTLSKGQSLTESFPGTRRR